MFAIIFENPRNQIGHLQWILCDVTPPIFENKMQRHSSFSKRSCCEAIGQLDCHLGICHPANLWSQIRACQGGRMGEGANGFGNGEIVMGMMLMKSGRMAMNGLHWQYAKKNTMLCMFIIIFCLFSVFLRLLSPQTIQKGRCGRIQANPQMRLAQHRALKTASSGFRSLRHLAIHFFPKQFTVGFTL